MSYRLVYEGAVVARGGLDTFGAAKRKLKALATAGAPGRYYIEDEKGVPIYGLHATDAPKTRRRYFRDTPDSISGMSTAYDRERYGFTTERVPGETVRKLKPGNMPWNR